MREVKLQTYWVDSDPAGIVYFAHFFRFVEQAEEELYLQKGIHRQDLLDKYSIWMPRVEAHVSFAKPIRNGQAIRIRINPIFQRQKTVRFEFEVMNDESSESLATGYMTVVCVDRANFKSCSLPEEIRRALEEE